MIWVPAFAGMSGSMRVTFNHPKLWFRKGRKLGERMIAPGTWEGWVLLLLMIAAVWAAMLLHLGT